ncbi:MAG: hypothetical protein JWQ40_599 [Segetibacter sp.]|nr:hypothetical protein [Segetibacter sp.]
MVGNYIIYHRKGKFNNFICNLTNAFCINNPYFKII